MPKRFSETDKWKDEWFSGLNPMEKLVFLFLIDNCDNAGFFELNQRLNSFLIGISEKEYLAAISGLSRGLISSKDCKCYWIRNFLFHQKNLPLNYENNAHKQIITIFNQKCNQFNFDFNKELGAKEGLISPIGKGIDNGKGEEDLKWYLKFSKQLFNESEDSKFRIEKLNMVLFQNKRQELNKQIVHEFNSNLVVSGKIHRTFNEYMEHLKNWLLAKPNSQNSSSDRQYKRLDVKQ